MKRNLKIAAGTIGLLVGLGFIMPALALLRQQGALPGFEVGLLLLGLVLGCAGLGSLWSAFRPAR